jgi:hypothetical protein
MCFMINKRYMITKGNKKRTLHRNWQHRVHKTKTNANLLKEYVTLAGLAILFMLFVFLIILLWA